MENRTVVILGTTASGKNRLAIKVAEQLGAEIVSMDSMKVFRGMDIGTAKPSAEDQVRVRHHLLDVVDPWEAFSVKRFVDLADAAVDDIHARGKLAIVVGGTMLYFKAFYEGLFEGPSGDPEIRAKIRARAESEGLPALYAELKQVDPITAERVHANDLRRIERALEVYYQSGQPISTLQQEWGQQIRRSDWRWLLVGVRRENENNSRRINMRVKEMVDAGLVEEARRLFDDPHGVGDQASQAVGYQELFEYFRGECPLEYAIEQVKIHSRRLAKHQRTWMRRLDGVHWIEVSKTHKGGAVMHDVLNLIAQHLPPRQE
jgi:tRNA dimethylallyltransferase